MKQGIIFDMDGTLWDSAENVANSWNEAIRAYQAKNEIVRKTLTTQDISGVMGKTMDVIADLLFPELEKTERMELLASCCEVENEYLRQHGGILYPELEETLQALKKICPLYIVSNCQAGYIEAFLKVTDLEEYVTDFENPGRTGKPKADNIRLVIERNNLDKAFYVGDTQGDYDATMAAGIPFIFAAYGFGNIDGDEEEIQGLNELPDLIDKLVEK